MNKLKINFKLSDEQKSNFFLGLLAKKRLFFILIIGIALIASFDMVYKKAYVDVNFIQYTYGNDGMGTQRENLTLEKIMKNIEQRKSNLSSNKGKKYKDPFNYANQAAAGNGAAIAPGGSTKPGEVKPVGM